jgi:hypothetical protein
VLGASSHNTPCDYSRAADSPTGMAGMTRLVAQAFMQYLTCTFALWHTVGSRVHGADRNGARHPLPRRCTDRSTACGTPFVLDGVVRQRPSRVRTLDVPLIRSQLQDNTYFCAYSVLNVATKVGVSVQHREVRCPSTSIRS